MHPQIYLNGPAEGPIDLVINGNKIAHGSIEALRAVSYVYFSQYVPEFETAIIELCRRTISESLRLRSITQREFELEIIKLMALEIQLEEDRRIYRMFDEMLVSDVMNS